MHRIDGPGATVDNKFTEGDPVGGVQATVVTDDWLNDLQENIMAVLAGAGIAPVKGDSSQLFKAIFGRSGTAGGCGRRNILINARGTINKRAYVSGTATTNAKQFCVDRWYVITSGQNLSWSDSSGIRTFTAPAGGVEQSIRAQNIFGGTYVLSYTGSATARVNGVVVANGSTVILPANTIASLRFTGGTFSNPQLELGTIPTSFDYPNEEQEELVCQKYYMRPNTAWLVAGNATAAGQRIMDAVFIYPQMISPPAVVSSAGAGVNVTLGALSVTGSSLTQAATSVTTGASSYSFTVVSLDSDFVV